MPSSGKISIGTIKKLQLFIVIYRQWITNLLFSTRCSWNKFYATTPHYNSCQIMAQNWSDIAACCSAATSKFGKKKIWLLFTHKFKLIIIILFSYLIILFYSMQFNALIHTFNLLNFISTLCVSQCIIIGTNLNLMIIHINITSNVGLFYST